MRKREEMLRDLHRRMDKYESDIRMKRAKVTKVAASVTPVCAVAIVGVGLWKGGILTPHSDQLISNTVDSTTSDVILSANKDASADKNTNNNKNGESATSAVTADRQATTLNATIPPATEIATEDSNTNKVSVEADAPDNTAKTNAKSQEVTGATATQTDATVQQATTDSEGQNGNSYFLKGVEESPTYPNLITSYSSGDNSMAVPPIGNYGCSYSLYLAMEDYKDTANYLVIADIFNENGQVSNYDDLVAEAARLCNNGYSATVETINSHFFISLNVTYEQLQSFAVRSDYAYALRLYNS